MTSAEAVEVVHQMIDAREQEQKKLFMEKQMQRVLSAESVFWKEVFHGFAVYGTAALAVLMFTLLMAVLQ